MKIGLRNILNELNVFVQCQKYRLSFVECPQFVFLVMGAVTVVAMIASYSIGAHYINDPADVALIVSGVTVVFLIIGFSITRGFDKLAEVSRMKSEFVSIVSHQLRSPLSNLKWALEILMSGRIGAVNEKQAEYFRILKENNDRMQELIRDLLVVSRIEQEQFPLNPEKFSLGGLVYELIDEFKPYIKASNVNVRVVSSEDLPMVLADKTRIKLVVENLLDNAIRYIKTKGRVDIRLSKKNNNIFFEISDNGVGIPKKDQKYIFKKFFRSENVMKYQTQGTGLGLYIAKSIINRSGGDIGFKSRKGKGTTFWFTLPVKK